MAAGRLIFDVQAAMSKQTNNNKKQKQQQQQQQTEIYVHEVTKTEPLWLTQQQMTQLACWRWTVRDLMKAQVSCKFSLLRWFRGSVFIWENHTVNRAQVSEIARYR